MMLPWNTEGLGIPGSLALPDSLLLGRTACVSECLLHRDKWETCYRLPLFMRDSPRLQNILQSLWRYREPLSLCICILHAHRTNMDVLYVTWIYNYTSVYLYHLYTDTLSFLGRRAAVWLCCLHDWLVRSSSKAGTWDHFCRMPETMRRCLGRDRTPMSLVFWDRVQRASYSGFWRMLRHQG